MFDEVYESDNSYGYFPHMRPIEMLLKSSIVVLDKPSGPTSHQVAGWVKDMLGVNKVGHGGTLDPGVTGVLPLMVGKASKLAPLLLKNDKEYVVLMRLHKQLNENIVREALLSLQGNEVEQLPPVKSAVSRKTRKRKVYSLDILEIEDRDVLFKIRVEAGTYIRKLCHDIGQMLGVGANMQELRRISSGSFSEEDAVILQDISEAMYLYKHNNEEERLREILLPVERAIKNIKKVYVKDDMVANISYGAPLFKQGIVMLDKNINKGERVAMLTMKGELIAIGVMRCSSNDVSSCSSMVAMPDSVIIERDLYPKKR